jgi:hypothetical protein
VPGQVPVVIEPTDEIQRAYAEAWYRAIGMDEDDVQRMVATELSDPMPWRIAALKAVLAIVERDYHLTLRTPAPGRCACPPQQCYGPRSRTEGQECGAVLDREGGAWASWAERRGGGRRA